MGFAWSSKSENGGLIQDGGENVSCTFKNEYFEKKSKWRKIHYEGYLTEKIQKAIWVKWVFSFLNEFQRFFESFREIYSNNFLCCTVILLEISGITMRRVNIEQKFLEFWKNIKNFLEFSGALPRRIFTGAFFFNL
jgi:hypothetical protein